MTGQDGDSLKSVLGSLSGYDIYVGVHGAQLTNTLYGAQGLVLVEVSDRSRDSVRAEQKKNVCCWRERWDLVSEMGLYYGRTYGFLYSKTKFGGGGGSPEKNNKTN